MIYAIARIVDDYGCMIGIRLLETDTFKTRDVYCNAIIKAIEAGGKIINIGYNGVELYGIGGLLGRYTAINKLGLQVSKASYIILYKNDGMAEFSGYAVASYTGEVSILSEKAVINLSKIAMLANAKVVTKGDIQYISPIQGKFPLKTLNSVKFEYDDTPIAPNMCISHTNSKKDEQDNVNNLEVYRVSRNKKYKIPEINPNYSIKMSPALNFSKSYEVRELTDKEASKMLKRLLGGINTKYINNKGLIGLFSKMRLYGANEVTSKIPNYYGGALYFDNGNSLQVFELSCYGKQFIIKTENSVNIVNDIMYIGKSWINLGALNESDNYGSGVRDNNDNNSKFVIMLGMTGLLIMREYKYLCIPYTNLDTKNNIINTLTNLGFDVSSINDSDIELIINQCRNNLYAINTNIKTTDLISLSDDIEINSDGALVGIKTYSKYIIDGILQGSMGLVSEGLRVEGYLKDSISLEIIYTLNTYRILQFSHSNSLFSNTKYVSDSLVDGKVFINRIRAEYIGYYGLYKLGKVSRISNAWLVKSDVENIDAQLINIDIIGDKLIIVFGTHILEYSIEGLLGKYKEELNVLENNTDSIKSFEAKSKLMGLDVVLDDAKYVIDWKENTEITVNKTLKGIRLRHTNIKSIKIRIPVDTDFVIDNRDSVYSFRRLVKIESCTKYVVRNIYSLCAEAGINYISVSLKDATADDLDIIISAFLRGQIRNTFVENGEYVKMHVKDSKYNSEFILNNIHALVDNIDDLDCICKSVGFFGRRIGYGGAVDIPLFYDKELMDTNEKGKYLRKLVRVLPMRGTKRVKLAAKLFKAIVEAVCTEEESERVILGMKRYLKLEQ